MHRIIKRNPNVGPRALKGTDCNFLMKNIERKFSLGALWRFAELANIIHPKKIRPFFEHLSAAFCSIATRSEDIVHEKLADYYEFIFRILGRSINDKEIKVKEIHLLFGCTIASFQELFTAYLANMSHESALIRRSSAACLIVICRHSRYPMVNARYLINIAIGMIEYSDWKIHPLF